jgi:hypothetical protein
MFYYNYFWGMDFIWWFLWIMHDWFGYSLFHMIFPASEIN